MKPVGSKWYNLGIDLLEEDDIDMLNTIQSQHPTDFNICCTEMFQLWLSKQPKASWNRLIESLRQPGVDLNLLASRIDQMLLQPKAAVGTLRMCVCVHACTCVCVHVCHSLCDNHDSAIV